MTDADLIYNACLRAERRIEAEADDLPGGSPERSRLIAAFHAVRTLREEIGRGLAAERR